MDEMAGDCDNAFEMRFFFPIFEFHPLWSDFECWSNRILRSEVGSWDHSIVDSDERWSVEVGRFAVGVHLCDDYPWLSNKWTPIGHAGNIYVFIEFLRLNTLYTTGIL